MRKKCGHCKKWYTATVSKGADKRQKYCSSICRERAWRAGHLAADRKYKFLRWQKFKKEHPLLCRYCNGPIPLGKRKSGVVFCSENCRHSKKLEDRLRFSRKVQELFRKYKESVGCKICGYKKCGAALDYHHRDKDKKERRITCKMWYANTKTIRDELKKCDLVCSNCHDEIHAKERAVAQ